MRRPKKLYSKKRKRELKSEMPTYKKWNSSGPNFAQRERRKSMRMHSSSKVNYCKKEQIQMIWILRSIQTIYLLSNSSFLTSPSLIIASSNLTYLRQLRRTLMTTSIMKIYSILSSQLPHKQLRIFKLSMGMDGHHQNK